MTTQSNIPTSQFKHIASKFPIKHREDLIQDMTLLYLESPLVKRTPLYVGTVYTLRCLDFLNKYTKDFNKEMLLDDYFGSSDCEWEQQRFVDILEDENCLEQNIIMDDLIGTLDLTEEEKHVQRLFYFEGYTVKEIVTLFAHKTFITSEKTIYKILTKGQ